jgi:periplasmic protein CpxP/Spy
MKRSIWSAAAALVIAAVVAIPVIAQPPQGRGGAGVPGGPGGFAGRGGPMPMLRTLDLTDAQREQIRTITRQQRDAADSPQQKLAALQKQLHLAILADSPETQKIDELKTAIAAAAGEELTSRIDVETRIAQVLTPEQRTKAREALAQPGPPNGRRGK